MITEIVKTKNIEKCDLDVSSFVEKLVKDFNETTIYYYDDISYYIESIIDLLFDRLIYFGSHYIYKSIKNCDPFVILDSKAFVWDLRKELKSNPEKYNLEYYMKQTECNK
jgi:hypothetical protein